jgi:3-oxoadipate enol-lactonase/4-carboxymuconolactone decarboxylase
MPIAELNGQKIFYDLTGPHAAPVVAFSNSLGTSIEMWDGVVRALAPHYRCLRYDARGHGRSAHQAGPAALRDYTDDLLQLLDRLDIGRAHIVGLSMGGMVAQDFASRYPARTGHLALLATASALPPADAWLMRAKTVREAGLGAIVEAVLQRWFSASADPAMVALNRERILAIDAHGYAAACEAIAHADLGAQLAQIKAPTLVVAATEDPVTTVAMGQDLAAGIAGAKFATVANAAHLFAIERAGETADLLLAFLPPTQPYADAPFAAGLANRKAVLGVDHVQRSLDRASGFGQPWQDFITRIAWGEMWGDDTLSFKTRSLVTLAMMIALGREAEFKLHLRPALKNGVTPAELRALLMHAAVYAGVPAVNGAFAAVREELGDLE